MLKTTESTKETVDVFQKEIFHPAFMKKYTGSKSFETWCKKTGLEINSPDDIKNNIDKFDSLTKMTTRFPSFFELFMEAGKIYLDKKINKSYKEIYDKKIEELKKERNEKIYWELSIKSKASHN